MPFGSLLSQSGVLTYYEEQCYHTTTKLGIVFREVGLPEVFR